MTTYQVISKTGQKNYQFSAFDQTNEYKRYDVVTYLGDIYQANQDMPMNTSFVEGNVGLTWRKMIQGGNTTSVIGVNSAGNITIDANGNVIISSAGVSNALVVTANGTTIAGNLTMTDANAFTIPGGEFGDFLTTDGNGHISWGNVSGAMAANGVNTSGNITTTGNVSSNNLTVTQTITGNTANFTTINTTSNITTQGNILTNGNITSNGGISSLGNITTQGNLVTNGNITSNSSIAAVGNITSGGTMTANAITSNTTITANGNITSNGTVTGNVLTGNLIIATGPITTSGELVGGSIVSNTTITANGNITSNGTVSGNTISGNTVVSSGNITSGGTITGEAITSNTTITANGNITSNGTVSGNAINSNTTITANGNITSNGTVSGNTIVGNTANFANLNITGNANLGDAGNLTILGGSNGQFLQTDGNGHLTWANAGAMSGNTGVVTSNSNVTLTVGGNTVQIIDANGVSTTGNTTVSGNVTANGNITGGNITTNGAVTTQTLYSNTTIMANGNITSNGTVSGNIIQGNTGNFSGNVAAGNITSNGSITSNTILANTANFSNLNVTGGANLGSAANLTITGGNVGESLLTLDALGNVGWGIANRIGNGNSYIEFNQSNGWGNIYVSGSRVAEIATGSFSVVGNSGITGNLRVFGSYVEFAGQLRAASNSAIALLKQTEVTELRVTDRATLPWANLISIAGGAANGQVLSLGNVSNGILAWSNISDLVSNTPGGANLNSNVINSNTIVSNGNITGNTLIANTITGGNISGNAAGLTNIPGANVVGNVTSAITANFANYAGNVTVAAQPNITSVGTLTGLTVSGIANLGANGNVKITGGANGQMLATDGSGGLSWVTISTSGASNGTSGTQVNAGNVTTTINGNIIQTITANGTSTNGNITATGNVTANYIIANGSQLTSLNGANVTGTVANANYAAYAGNVTIAAQANITSVGNLTSLTVSGNSNLGSNANLKLSGGTAGQALFTDGAGNLSWTTVSANTIFNGNSNVAIPSAGGNVNISASGNANVVVVTGNGLNVTGKANISNTLTISGGGAQITGDMSLNGNLNVVGNVNYNNVAQLVIGDPLIFIASNNGTDVVDSGLVSTYNSNVFTGIARNKNNGTWTVFDNLPTSPTTVIDWGSASAGKFLAGNTTVSSLTASGLVTLGNIGNVKINGGASGQLLSTDGTGGLSWVSVSGGANYIANGVSNLQFTGSGGNLIGAVDGAANSFFLSPTVFSAKSLSVLLGAGNASTMTPGVDYRVAVGYQAGDSSQATNTVAIGNAAGKSSQLANSVAIGASAGQTAQAFGAVAIGSGAGRQNQGANAVAIGLLAGYSTQGANSVAIGQGAGATSQHANTIVINATGANVNTTQADSFYAAPVRNDTANTTNLMYYNATTKEVTYASASAFSSDRIANGSNSLVMYANSLISGNNPQGNSGNANIIMIGDGIAMGPGAGADWISQGRTNWGGRISLGVYAGASSQYFGAIAIGSQAGRNNQGIGAIGVGTSAGFNNQNNYAVAVGDTAGQSGQGNSAVALGQGAGGSGQGIFAVAVGAGAGATSQAASALALGANAGASGQHSNTIILNGSGTALNSTQANSFFASSVRNDTGNTTNYMFYNSSTKEISYSTVAPATPTQIVNGTSNTVVALNGVVTTSVAGTANVLTVTATGANVTGTANISGNISGGNITTTGNVSGANITGAHYGAGNNLSNIQGANVTGNVTSAITANFANFAGNVTAAAQANITSVGTLTSLTVSGISTLGSNANVKITGGSTSQVLSTDGAGNLSWVSVSAAATANYSNFAGNVTAAAQPNITSVGTLTSLAVTGNVTGANFTGAHYGAGNNLSNIQGANVTGNVTSAVTANFANFAGNVTVAAQPNITSVGTLTSLTVTGNTTSGNFTTTGTVTTANLNATGANVSLGFVSNVKMTGGTSGQFLQTDGAGTLSWATVSLGAASNISNGTSNVGIDTLNGNVAIKVNGTTNIAVFSTAGVNVAGVLNVTGNIAGGNLTTAGQVSATGNITGANITANANLTTANLTVTGISTLGAVGNVRITGGTAGQFLQTNGSGNLVWASEAAMTGIANGTSNVGFSGANGNILFGVGGNAAGVINSNIVVLGDRLGFTHNGFFNSVAIGTAAGKTGQMNDTVAIGGYAGEVNQSSGAVAIGTFTGQNAQGLNAVSIGKLAAVNQNEGAIAIGYNAVNSVAGIRQGANSIVLNATGSNITAAATSFYVAPVRNDTGNTANVMYYNTTTKEVTYAALASGTSLVNGTSNVVVDLSGKVRISSQGTANVLSATSSGINVIGILNATDGASFFGPVVESFATITGATGVVVHNIATTSIFNHTSIAANFTVNLTNISFSAAGKASVVTLMLNQGSTAYIPNALQIGGVAQTIKWQGTTAPTGNANKLDAVAFTIFCTAASTYVVTGQLVSYG